MAERLIRWIVRIVWDMVREDIPYCDHGYIAITCVYCKIQRGEAQGPEPCESVVTHDGRKGCAIHDGPWPCQDGQEGDVCYPAREAQPRW